MIQITTNNSKWNNKFEASRQSCSSKQSIWSFMVFANWKWSKFHKSVCFVLIISSLNHVICYGTSASLTVQTENNMQNVLKPSQTRQDIIRTISRFIASLNKFSYKAQLGKLKFINFYFLIAQIAQTAKTMGFAILMRWSWWWCGADAMIVIMMGKRLRTSLFLRDGRKCMPWVMLQDIIRDMWVNSN